VLVRALATVFNRFPIRWQRRFMTAAHAKFVVGVAGLGVDRAGRVLLARHRFGSPPWRLLGGFIARAERLEEALRREIREETGLEAEIGPLLEASTGQRWARVELVYLYRVTGGAERLSGEVAELGWFAPEALPRLRADQRELIARHAERAREWLRSAAHA
jgi:8-oxo-dGTP diphosphatase